MRLVSSGICPILEAPRALNPEAACAPIQCDRLPIVPHLSGVPLSHHLVHVNKRWPRCCRPFIGSPRSPTPWPGPDRRGRGCPDAHQTVSALPVRHLPVANSAPRGGNRGGGRGLGREIEARGWHGPVQMGYISPLHPPTRPAPNRFSDPLLVPPVVCPGPDTGDSLARAQASDQDGVFW